MAKKPSKSETDEDLLKQYQEFVSSKSAPAVSVLRSTAKRPTQESQETATPVQG
jgi:hypothetical protein